MDKQKLEERAFLAGKRLGIGLITHDQLSVFLSHPTTRLSHQVHPHLFKQGSSE